MDERRMGRRARVAAAASAGAVALAAVGAAAAAAGGDDAGRAAVPPFTKRCAVEFRAYSDGSANIFCAERAKPFAAVDAESGRIRFYR